MTSRVCQGLVSQIKNNIKALGVLKSHKRKVGALKYKSEYNSIPFDQYYITHRIVSSSRIKIAGIKLPVRVSGLQQIKDLKPGKRPSADKGSQRSRIHYSQAPEESG